MNRTPPPLWFIVVLLCGLPALRGDPPAVPDWALPGSATHQQVPPPVDYHRASRIWNSPIGIFDGQADIGAAVVPGDARFDPAEGRYTIRSAGYNIWYTRDEFRYLWKKMSGEVYLAVDLAFPDPQGYDDRKVVLVIRQNLTDDAKEVMTAWHGRGLVHLALRPTAGADIVETFHTMAGHSGAARRLGIRKHGDEFTLLASLDGEPLHPVGPPARLSFDAPFYVGVGFCSHLPATADTAIISNVVLHP